MPPLSSEPEVRAVATSVGDARTHLRRARRPKLTLVLGHGAGGGIEARDLQLLAATLPRRGISVALVEQPWRVAGRKTAAPPTQLDTAWLEVLDAVRPDGPVVVGGRSAGARVACRTASKLGALGALSLAFPLHPPGKPEKSRLDELLGCGSPAMVVQGERDPFGRPAEFPADADVRAVPDADHGFAVPKSSPVGQDAALERLLAHVTAWLDDLPT
jgi:predicted alpha/beta-hydrolase family hydrolase